MEKFSRKCIGFYGYLVYFRQCFILYLHAYTPGMGGHCGEWILLGFHVISFLKFVGISVLSVRFEVGVSLLPAPTGADKRGPKAPFPQVENTGIQPAIRKRTRRSSGGSQVLLTTLHLFHGMKLMFTMLNTSEHWALKWSPAGDSRFVWWPCATQLLFKIFRQGDYSSLVTSWQYTFPSSLK